MKEKTIQGIKVTMIPPVTKMRPIDGRKYTLRISENREEWNLRIGYEYKRKETRLTGTELVAKWRYHRGHYLLGVHAKSTNTSFDQLKKDVERFLSAIVRGDELFFHHFPWVLDVPIFVTYELVDGKTETTQIGTPRHFMNAKGEDVILNEV